MENPKLSGEQRRRLYVVIAVLATVSALGLLYADWVKQGIGIPCLFYSITGWRCPGCGISRSLSALLHFRFDQFIQYNLLAPVIVQYLLLWGGSIAKNYVQKGKAVYTSPCKWIDITILSVLLLWWPLRNVLGL